ncbi:MAG: ATPase [Synergistaceae bacterium]|jgi:V/A-type H+-transporting ATPase subunit I|nr:ATPase [Synergistaceae bacterium]
MAVMKMVAVTMVGPHEEMEPVARQMVLSGGFQPLPLDFLINDRNLRSRITTESENPYDELLNKMSTVWRTAGENVPDPEPTPFDSRFSFHKARRLVDETAGKLEAWSRHREALAEELEQLEATKVYVGALTELKMKPRELSETQFAVAHFGRMSADSFSRLEETTLDAPILAVELSRSNDNVWALIFTVPGYRDGARKILDAVYFKEYSLVEISNRMSEDDPLGQVEQGISFHKSSIKGLEDAASAILKERGAEFENLYSRLYTMQRVYDLCKGRGEIGGMYVLSGWIPEDTYAAIKEHIERDAPRTSITVEQVKNIATSGARIPTMLRNNRVVRAFQDVVALYSVPSYGEVDPSPFVALTFILFFGFMFGDSGHGVLLWLGATYLGKKKILSRSLAYVMKCASCSSVIFGLLYGSVMGVEGILPALWLSPMRSPGQLFGVAIVCGVVMISVGMILNMVVRYRDRDFGRLLFDGQGLAGLFVYWGSAIGIFIGVSGAETPFPLSWLWYVIAAVLALTLFRDTLARTILHQHVEREGKALQVFEVLHNLMNYFTNTASFVRLAAFALTHVAMSFAVMTISDMLGNLPGGALLKVFMLILGNIFIVGVESLIVFIQVLRLEYYEFFGKFYRGGGNVFKPVTWQRDRSLRKLS